MQTTNNAIELVNAICVSANCASAFQRFSYCMIRMGSIIGLIFCSIMTAKVTPAVQSMFRQTNAIRVHWDPKARIIRLYSRKSRVTSPALCLLRTVYRSIIIIKMIIAVSQNATIQLIHLDQNTVRLDAPWVNSVSIPRS